jgi:hypothetical protein
MRYQLIDLKKTKFTTQNDFVFWKNQRFLVKFGLLSPNLFLDFERFIKDYLRNLTCWENSKNRFRLSVPNLTKNRWFFPKDKIVLSSEIQACLYLILGNSCANHVGQTSTLFYMDEKTKHPTVVKCESNWITTFIFDTFYQNMTVTDWCNINYMSEMLKINIQNEQNVQTQRNNTSIHHA